MGSNFDILFSFLSFFNCKHKSYSEMSLLDDSNSNDEKIILVDNNAEILKNSKKTESNLIQLLEKLESKPQNTYDVSDIKYSGIVFYKPVGVLEWKRKRVNISGDIIQFFKVIQHYFLFLMALTFIL